MDQFLPSIEEDIILPDNAQDALPDLSPQEELDMRARTITFLAQLQGQPIEPSAEDQSTARELAHQMMNDPSIRPEYSKYPNEVLAFLAGMVAQTNCMIVDDLAQLKLFVVNRLVQAVNDAKDEKTRIMALRTLGEVSGVDAFQKRVEITVRHKPLDEVEKELRLLLDSVVVTQNPTPPPALPPTEATEAGE